MLTKHYNDLLGVTLQCKFIVYIRYSIHIWHGQVTQHTRGHAITHLWYRMAIGHVNP